LAALFIAAYVNTQTSLPQRIDLTR